MDFLRQVLLYVSLTSIVFLAIGLYKPWIMLWWEDVQNRRKVLKIYGLAAVASYGLHWGIRLLNEF